MFSPLVLIPHAWNADVMAGALSAILGHKETLKVEAVLVKTEQEELGFLMNICICNISLGSHPKRLLL